MLDEKLSSTVMILWFNFILGLNFIFLCFELIIIRHIEGVDINWDVSPVSPQVTVF